MYIVDKINHHQFNGTEQAVIRMGKLSALWNPHGNTIFTIRCSINREDRVVFTVSLPYPMEETEIKNIAYYYMNCFSYGIDPVFAQNMVTYGQYIPENRPYAKKRFERCGLYMNGVYNHQGRFFVCQDVLNTKRNIWSGPIVNAFDIATNERLGIPIESFKQHFTYYR